MTEETALTEQPKQEIAAGVSIWTDSAALASAYKAAKFLASSELVPEQTYKDKPQNCLIALDMANRMNMHPLVVMQNLYIVKGKPTWSGQFCITAINGCGKFTPLEYLWTDENGKGCACRATRIADGKVCTGSVVSMKMAADEGWVNKPGSKWKTMPEQMMMYRAAAFFARTFCPEVLMGLQTVEEVKDVKGYDEDEKETITITLNTEDKE